MTDAQTNLRSLPVDARDDIGPVRTPVTPLGDAALEGQKDGATQRDQVRDFIRAMSAELSVMAHKNGLDRLALIFENAREVAEASLERRRPQR